MKSRHLARLATVLWLIAASSIARTDWFDADWNCRQRIMIGKNMVGAGNPLTNFPLLVSITNVSNAVFTRARPDGSDIRFTQADGTTSLPHEIERFDPVARQLICWVGMPTLASDEDTEIQMYYDNDFPDIPDASTQVWDPHFTAVWHLHGASGTNADSTAYGNSTTNRGSVTMNAPGQIGGSLQFHNETAATGYVLIPATSSLAVRETFTFSVWANRKDLSDYPSASTILCRGVDTPGYFCYWFYVHADKSLFFKWSDGVSSDSLIASLGSMPCDDRWQYCAVTFDKGHVHLFIDGQAATNTMSPVTSAYLRYSGIYMGKYQNTAVRHHFNGALDELRIADTARSAAWIQTEYNNQSAPADYLGVMPEEQFVPDGTLITIL